MLFIREASNSYIYVYIPCLLWGNSIYQDNFFKYNVLGWFNAKAVFLLWIEVYEMRA